MINGIVNVLKATGMSSHDVIGQMRRIYGMKKIGHSGTLDPLAAGVLPVYLGQATRLIEYGDNGIKTYHAEFALGFATDTEDSTGEVVASAAVPDLSAEDISAVLASFCGDIEQTPSRYSAINVNGVKAYKLARQNADFTLPGRRVTIYEIRLLSYQNGRGVIAVTCSKGTYIRSLARDIAYRLGSVAHLVDLERYRIGPFTYGDVTGIPASLEESERNLAKVIPAVVDFDRRMLGRLADGYMSPRGILSIDMPQEVRYRLHCDGRLVGVVERRDDGRWSIVALVNREDL